MNKRKKTGIVFLVLPLLLPISSAAFAIISFIAQAAGTSEGAVYAVVHVLLPILGIVGLMGIFLFPVGLYLLLVNKK